MFAQNNKFCITVIKTKMNNSLSISQTYGHGVCCVSNRMRFGPSEHFRICSPIHQPQPPCFRGMFQLEPDPESGARDQMVGVGESHPHVLMSLIDFQGLFIGPVCWLMLFDVTMLLAFLMLSPARGWTPVVLFRFFDKHSKFLTLAPRTVQKYAPTG